MDNVFISRVPCSIFFSLFLSPVKARRMHSSAFRRKKNHVQIIFCVCAYKMLIMAWSHSLLYVVIIIFFSLTKIVSKVIYKWTQNTMRLTKADKKKHRPDLFYFPLLTSSTEANQRTGDVHNDDN